MNILIVEDEKELSDVLATLLRQQNYAVDIAGDGITGEENALSGIYDAIILDIMLPAKNGIDVLRSLRAQGISTPILLLTARSEIEEKISGLNTGADDYLTKPFVSGELLARIRAITRRTGEFTADDLSFDGTLLNKNTYQLSYKGNSVKLSQKEFQIMEMLMNNQKRIIPKERMIEKIWGFNNDAEYNNIEVYVSFLRKKLAAIISPMQIIAVRGVGYTLEGNK